MYKEDKNNFIQLFLLFHVSLYFYLFVFSLTGTLYINKNIPVNIPELAKGCFSSVVPGQDGLSL